MKVLAASLASWVLGMVGWWALHLQRKVWAWSGLGDVSDLDEYKAGGSGGDDD